MRKYLAINKKHLVIIGVVVSVICIAIKCFMNSMVILNFLPIDSLGKKLYSSDPSIIRESLAIMRHKGASNEIERAIILLTSEDDYVWLAAAHYLGKNGVTNSVPYLFKALRHTAYRGDEDALRYLQEMTGVNNGAEFYSWYLWWARNNKTDYIDWNSNLGPNPRLCVETQK